MRCANCDKTLGRDFFKTAYGDFLCEDCWDDYICTQAGKLEYLIGICRGDYPADDFDTDFLGEVAVSWMINYNKLDLTPQERSEIEEEARRLGLL
jgi:recombinational DNA repair protein (RecF pathway)